MNDPDTQTRLQAITEDSLTEENLRYTCSGGVSTHNRLHGFVPAFLDTATGNIYRSQHADGTPAAIHVLAGLPLDLFEPDSSSNGQLTVKKSVISGFMRERTFYSRAAAAIATTSSRMH